MTATAPSIPATFPCPRCGNLLGYGTLACPRCGGLVYAQRLNELASAAQREEAAGNPVRAAMIWRECLPLLPPDSQQYQMVSQRVGQLATGFGMPAHGSPSPYAGPFGGDGGGDPPPVPAGPMAATRGRDPWPVALFKTGGSMLVSIAVYTMLFSGRFGTQFGLMFATGFVLLMLVHELGHSFAMRYYGLSASPPIFIPFLGAVINLRQMPRNALEEAVVGIGGPVLGTVGAVITYAAYLQTGSPLLLMLAEFGFLLNLFNMLPVPPLDGGRVTAAVSPWIWIPGLLGAAGMIVHEYYTRGRINPILILLLIMAWPRVKRVLTSNDRSTPYYQIGRAATWGMGVAYVLLGGFLAVMFFVAREQANQMMGM